jgi:hypothetical protein
MPPQKNAGIVLQVPVIFHVGLAQRMQPKVWSNMAEMDGIGFSKIFVIIYRTTRRHSSEDSNRHTRRGEKMKSHSLSLVWATNGVVK